MLHGKCGKCILSSLITNLSFSSTADLNFLRHGHIELISYLYPAWKSHHPLSSNYARHNSSVY